jgi:tRNA dimethylallyltransferase
VEILECALTPGDRALLHARIEARFASMWAAGFLEEVRGLRERNTLSAEHPSMRAVGYRQLWMFLAGQCSLEEAKKRAVAATRQLAKRQSTWLKKRHRALWLDSEHSDLTSAVVNALSKCGFAGWSYA